MDSIKVVLSKVATAILELLGYSPNTGQFFRHNPAFNNAPVTTDEDQSLTVHAEPSGILEEAEQKILERVSRLRHRTVSSLMTHRSELVWLDTKDPIEENLKKIIASGHSLFLVCEDSLDHIIGLTHVKDLFKPLAAGYASLVISAQIPPLVPEGMNTLNTLERLRASKSQLAVVFDEYGSVTGMVTLTDLLEAIVGDLPGLDTREQPASIHLEDGSWLIDGRLPIDKLQLLLDLEDLPEKEANYTTVSGLFMAHLGRIPLVGDKFEWQQLNFEVVEMDGQRVDKVMITPTPFP